MVKDRNRHLLKYSSVKRWSRGVKENTFETHLDAFRLWLDYVAKGDSKFKGYSPDMFVEYQKEHRNYEIKDLVQDWVNNNRGLRKQTLVRYYSVPHSFFLHNRAVLPEDPYKPRSEAAPVVGDLTPEEIRNVILASNPLYQAVFSCMYMGIMGCGELLYWSDNGYLDLEDQLEADERVVIAWQSGRKLYANSIPFYNMIGGDSLRFLKVYLNEYRPKGDGAIFQTKNGTAVNYAAMRQYWRRRLKELGIVEQPDGADSSTRYGKNLHEIRDVGRTRWRKSSADVNLAEFMMGHMERLDPNEYEKIYRDIGYSKREYRKAIPWMNLVSEDPEKIPIEQYEKDMQRLDVLEERVNSIDSVLEDPELAPILWEALDRIKAAKKK